MAGNWFPIRHDLVDDPDVINLAERLGKSRPEVLGYLLIWWSWVDRHCSNEFTNVTLASADCHVGLRGWCDAMIAVGWMGVDEVGNATVPYYEEFFSRSAKKRLSDARRQRNQRNQNRKRDKRHTTSVTNVTTERDANATTEQNRTKKKEKTNKKKVADQLTFPPEIASEKCRELWSQWLAHKSRIRKPYKTIESQQAQLNRLASLGEERFCEAIRFSIAQEYQGIHEPSGSTRRGGGDQTGSRIGAPPGKYDGYGFQEDAPADS